MATTDTTETSLTTYRVAMLEELGFSNKEATSLSEAYYPQTITYKGNKKAKKTYLIRVDHHYVRKMLSGGATKEQVLAILI